MSFKLRFSPLLLLLVLAGPCAAASERRDQVEAHTQQGLAYARQGNLEQAEVELRQAVILAPNDAEVLAAFGTVLAMERKLADSTDAFKKVLRINPNDATSRRYLAANLWQLHLYGEARKNLTILLKQQPDDKEAQLLLGMVSENMGNYATAARALAAVPEEVDKQPEAVAALARSYYRLLQTEKARVTLARLVGPQAQLLGAQIADEMGDYESARKILRSLESASSDRAAIQFRQALVEYHAGQFARSQQVLQNLISGAGSSAQALNLLGWCYQKQGRTPEAVQALKDSIKLAPGEEANYVDLGKILLAGRSLPRALEAARQATDAFPNSAAALELRGRVELQMGQFTDAIRSFRQSTELDSSRASGILGLAQAQFAAGLTREANTSFESGTKRFPRDAHLQAEYAVVLLKQSETGGASQEARAEKMLRAALALDDSIGEAHYQLGNVALKNGKALEAQQHLERAVKLDPDSEQAHFALSRTYRRLGRKHDAAREMQLYEQLKNRQNRPPDSNPDVPE